MIEMIKKFIFPSRCVICDEILPFGKKLQNDFLCDDCRKKVEFIKEPTCRKCGAMIYDKEDLYCTRCKSHLHEGFEYGFGLCRYNDAVKESLHKIKYEGRKEYIDFYGKCIAKVYKDRIKEISPDYLIPVPIHSTRLRERTYNQSSVLAYSISEELKKYGINIEVNEKLIYRIKNTRVLNKLDNEERSKELKEAFLTSDLSGIEKVLLVDDIYTTGGTINAIAKTLKEAGVNEIYFVVVAIVDNL